MVRCIRYKTRRGHSLYLWPPFLPLLNEGRFIGMGKLQPNDLDRKTLIIVCPRGLELAEKESEPWNVG
jgi:hypothetical protein